MPPKPRHLLPLLVTLLLALPGASQAGSEPGHPSVEQAQSILGMPEAAELRYSGRVVQAIDSNAYTYVLVERDDGARGWIAAPRTELRPGQPIRFAHGRVMNNFYSKKLKYTFDNILFTPRIVVGPTR